jgi:hypothetical protein
MFEPGSIVCLKTTGEIVVVLGPAEEGEFTIRRPVMTSKDGIRHSIDNVFAIELETEEEHLRREAAAMILKIKIQDELQDQMEADRKDKIVDTRVN